MKTFSYVFEIVIYTIFIFLLGWFFEQTMNTENPTPTDISILFATLMGIITLGVRLVRSIAEWMRDT